MKHFNFLMLAILAILAILLLGQTATAQDRTKLPTVLELFTSQSCSSCPPADKLLHNLATEDRNIIALSCNVTYWNHLNWRDTLSKKFCTDRQYAYSHTMGKSGVYTPQLVINGIYETVGSQRGAVENAINKTHKNPLARLGLTRQDDILQVTLPETGKPSTLYLIVYGEDVSQPIKYGENRNKTVSYTNPVQSITRIKDWDGHAATITADIPETATRMAVIAQMANQGPIIAAGKLPL